MKNDEVDELKTTCGNDYHWDHDSIEVFVTRDDGTIEKHDGIWLISAADRFAKEKDDKSDR